MELHDTVIDFRKAFAFEPLQKLWKAMKEHAQCILYIYYRATKAVN